MAVFISCVTSPFQDVFDDASRESRATRNVRRPFRGIELKKDTYATIKVIDALGRPVLFTDSSAPPAAPAEDDAGNFITAPEIGASTEYSNFILQSVTEQRVEKQQIVETFGEDYIFFFGERPRIYNFTALLLNSRNFNWKNEWWKNYEDILRGTRLLERNARMYIYYDDVVIEGYMLTAQAMSTVDDPYKLPLSFQVFCTNYSIIGDVGSIFTPTFQGAVAERDSITGADLTSANPMAAVPEDDEVLARNAESLFADSSSLTGFLADAARYANDATFSIQRKLEQMKNAFYGRSLAFPNQGVGNQIYVPPITNQANFPPPPNAGRRLPIFMQKDEYTQYYSETNSPAYDFAEMSRVHELLRLSGPEELDKRATGHLLALGVNVGRPSAEYLLLGRAAFAGAQTFGSFGIRQADGVLSIG